MQPAERWNVEVILRWLFGEVSLDTSLLLTFLLKNVIAYVIKL